MSNRSPALFAVLALAAPCLWSAHAQTGPVEIEVSSPRSTDGSFGLMITGASRETCASLVANITLEGGAALRFRALRDCQYEVTPEQSLSAGRHCIDVHDSAGRGADRCFEITGVAADASAAKLTLASRQPDSWLPAECGQCPSSGAKMPCTRQRRQRAALLTLEAVPSELVSRYAFAVVDLGVEGSQQPADFFLLDAALGTPLSIMQRAADRQACIDVYARPFSATEASKLGQLCLPAALPDTAPATFRAGSACEVAYRAKWCGDNRLDCATDAAREGCGLYPSVCEVETDAGGADVGAASASSDASMDAPDARPPTAADAGADEAQRRASGCSTRGPGGAGGWLIAVLAAALLRRRPAGKQASTLRRASRS